MMKLSEYIRVVELRKNLFAVYNALLLDVFYLNNIELEDLYNLRFSSEELEHYRKSGIIVNDENTDIMAINSLKSDIQERTKKIEIMYLILSSACNLGCKYCFIENNHYNNHEETNMPLNILTNAVNKFCNYVVENEIEHPLITFYGGEPTVNWKALEKAVEIVEKKKSLIKFNMVTNATLLTEDKIKYLVEHNIELGISIDGPKKLNDENRVYRKSNESVYDKVIENIGYLRKYNARFGLSLTVSDQLLENQDVVIEWLKELKVPSIFYNLYHFSERGDWKEYYKSACEFLLKSYDILKPFGIYDGRLQRKVDSFFKDSFKYADCAAIGANQITIKPNGQICVCQGYLKSNKYELGNIIDVEIKELIKSEEFDFWEKRVPLYRKECLECEALYLCGGGCSMQAEALFNKRDAVDIAFCIHTKTSLKWLLNKGYELSIENIEC